MVVIVVEGVVVGGVGVVGVVGVVLSSRREDPVADNETSAPTQVRKAKCIFRK